MKTQKKFFRFFLAFACASIAINALADGADSNALTSATSSGSNVLVKTEAPPVPWHPISLSAEGGTTGGGVTLGIRFSDHFGVSGGADAFRYSIKDQSYGDVNYNSTARLMTENVGLRLYPSKDASFYLCLGAVFNQNRVDGINNGAATVNGIPLPPGEYLKLRYEQQPVVPFAAIGGNFFYFDSAHHWSFGGELGAFLLGNPKVTLHDTGATIPASDLQAQVQKIDHDLKRLPVWPVIKLQLTYAF